MEEMITTYRALTPEDRERRPRRVVGAHVITSISRHTWRPHLIVP